MSTLLFRLISIVEKTAHERMLKSYIYFRKVSVMEETKILILTLGKGTAYDPAQEKESGNNAKEQLTADEIVQKLKSGEYTYRTAKYQYEEQPITESPFVGTVLFGKYKPNKMAVVGTGSSMWTELYHKLCLLSGKTELTDEQQKNMSKILDYESACNRNTEDAKIEEEEELLNALFSELAAVLKIQIRIILTRYGVNEEELVYNYGKFKQLRNLFEYDKDKVNKVAFDITHSFRSLPIFNLAILKYVQSITDSKVIIEKVFYGNLDISGEYDGVAPIVDLSMLTKTIDLANGIVEFKNTGNAVTISKIISEMNPDSAFVSYLQGFDWATQTNSRGELLENLHNILDYNFSRVNAHSPLVYDAEYTMQTALRETFGNLSSCDLYEQQLRLAKWSLQQGRVGLAAVISIEAFRSFLVNLYIGLEGRNVDPMDEDERKRAEQIFRNRCKQVGESHIFHPFPEIEVHAKRIRNIFAHNLQDDSETENYDFVTAKEKIRQYLECIEKIIGQKPDEFIINHNNAIASAGSINYLVIANKESGLSLNRFARKAVKNNNNRSDVTLWVVEDVNLEITGEDAKKKSSNRKKIAKILCGRIAEHFALGKLKKIVWDANLDDSLILNTSMLIKNVVGSHISFQKMKQNGSENTILLPYWKIDAEALLADASTNFFNEYNQVTFRQIEMS